MKIQCTVTGITPILMNRFTEQEEVAVSSGLRSSIKPHAETPRMMAMKKLYADDKGNLFLPGTMIFATIVAAGVYHKLGRRQVTTQKTSLIPAGLCVTDLVCPLGTKHWEVDSRSVVNPKTGGRIMCHRPRLDEWATTFTMEVDTNMFGEKTVRLLVDDAGSKCGLGDYRPARKGPFGRFVVQSWNVS